MTGKLKALVVGINDYGSPQNNLPSCIADAEAFTKVLVERYNFKSQDIRSLYDAEANRGKVEQELDWLVDDAEEEDRLVFYYSGHGYTKYVGGDMEEFLVLRDGLWQDDNLSKMTQHLPSSVLTVILDSCFSGGMHKVLADPFGAGEDIELARTKVWMGTPPGEVEGNVAKELILNQSPLVSVKRFGIARCITYGCIGRVLRPEAFAFPVESPYLTQGAEIAAKQFLLPAVVQPTAPQAKVGGQEDEPNQLEMRGLLISACLPDETAAASTSRTQGLSAFTYSLVQTLSPVDSVEEAVKATAAQLKNLKFRQTPMVLESGDPGDLKYRGFITFDVATTQVEADEKFWEALGSIFVPLVSTVAPTILNALIGRTKDLPPEFTDAEQAEKFWGGLARVLPSLIRVVAPVVVNALTKEQISSSSVVPSGTDNSDPAGRDKFWGIVASLLPSVVSAVAPMVINALGGRGKSADWSTKVWEDEAVTPEEEKLFWDAARIVCAPWVTNCFPIIGNAMLGQTKGFSTMQNGDGHMADEKLFGAIASLIPTLIQAAAPIMIDAISGAQSKAQMEVPLYDEGVGDGATDEAMKIFDLDRETIRLIMASVGDVVRTTMSGQTPGFRPITDQLADGEEGEKSFWSVVRSIVRPIVSTGVPLIMQALTGGQTKEVVLAKRFVLEGSPSSVPDDVIRSLVR